MQLSARRCPVRIWVPIISLEGAMISGAHVVVYSKDADADRAFFRDVLGFKSVDAGHGWLIFALPPGEAAFHPSEENGLHELYFICEDLKSEMASLATKDVRCSKVEEARWGLITKMLSFPKSSCTTIKKVLSPWGGSSVWDCMLIRRSATMLAENV